MNDEDGPLILKADLLASEVPVYLGDNRSYPIGEAVIFQDGNTLNALIEIYEKDNELFKNYVELDMGGISLDIGPEIEVIQKKEEF